MRPTAGTSTSTAASSRRRRGRRPSSSRTTAARSFPGSTSPATSCSRSAESGSRARRSSRRVEACLARSGPRRRGEEVPVAALRRHAAARGDRASARLAAGDPAARRAVRLGGRAHAHRAPGPRAAPPSSTRSKGVTIVHVTHDIDEAVYLADRVLVLSGTPGRIVASVDVPLSRPREQTETRSSPQFLELRNELHVLIASRESVQSRAQ